MLCEKRFRSERRHFAQQKTGISHTKGFRYPPVLPIVYYEGSEAWTADRLLSDRIVLNEMFKDYIPDFKYYLISLNDHDNEALIGKKDALSFVMLINKIKSAEEFKNLTLPENYLNSLLNDSPEDVLKTISRVIAVVLRKQNVPETNIQNLVDKIERRENMGLWDEWHGFDYQEVSRVSEEKGIEKGEVLKVIKLVCRKMAIGKSPSQISSDLMEDEDQIRQIYDIALKYAPDYDPEKIYEELSENKDLVES